MKILMIARALPAHRKGGVPDHAWMLARGLASRGIGVHILTTRLKGSPPVAVSDGVTVHYLQNTAPDSYAGGWWAESARNVASLHSGERFDVIHCQDAAEAPRVREPLAGGARDRERAKPLATVTQARERRRVLDEDTPA